MREVRAFTLGAAVASALIFFTMALANVPYPAGLVMDGFVLGTWAIWGGVVWVAKRRAS